VLGQFAGLVAVVPVPMPNVSEAHPVEIVRIATGPTCVWAKAVPLTRESASTVVTVAIVVLIFICIPLVWWVHEVQRYSPFADDCRQHVRMM
jgi:hypothetical protein